MKNITLIAIENSANHGLMPILLGISCPFRIVTPKRMPRNVSVM